MLDSQKGLASSPSVMFPFFCAPPHLLYFRQHKHTIAGREICAEEWWKWSTKHFLELC